MKYQEKKKHMKLHWPRIKMIIVDNINFLKSPFMLVYCDYVPSPNYHPYIIPVKLGRAVSEASLHRQQSDVS